MMITSHRREHCIDITLLFFLLLFPPFLIHKFSFNSSCYMYKYICMYYVCRCACSTLRPFSVAHMCIVEGCSLGIGQIMWMSVPRDNQFSLSQEQTNPPVAIHPGVRPCRISPTCSWCYDGLFRQVGC